MSMKSEPIEMELEALPDSPGHDDIASGDNDLENQRNLSHEENDALEKAVMQTARGRTFLREHARRNRAVASDLVMRALDDYRVYFQRYELKQPIEILAAELQDMSDAIKLTRRDIASIKPEDGANNRIMAATEDLDAIVTATERATNDILAAAERIQESVLKMRENGGDGDLLDTLEEDITNIFLACSFQDITGQRTTKVVNALRYLEQRVGAMIQIWGSQTLRNGADEDFGAELDDEKDAEASLLNGPQLEGQGVDQSDIDQLLNGDVEQLIAAAKEVDESGLLDKPTAGVELDTAATTPEPEFEAAGLQAAEDQLVEVADGRAPDADEDTDDYSGLSEQADADTIDAIFNC